MSARRTYADAVSWIKSGRPPDLDRWALAFRIFGAGVATGLVVWGVWAYVSPARFGQPGAEILSLGWPTIVYATLVLAGVAALVQARARIVWARARIKEPYERNLTEHPGYEDAVNALAACSRPLQVRFAIAWTWGPTITVIIAIVLAFSAAYICVYATLGRFEVGWQTYALLAGDVIVGVGLLTLMAGRLSTWRVATSVYRSIIPM